MIKTVDHVHGLCRVTFADKISGHGVAGGDILALLALIDRYRRQAEEHLKQPVRVVSCYETGSDGFWLHRLLRASGIENHVMDPASLPVDRRARRMKTDRLDLGTLLQALKRLRRAERAEARRKEGVGPSPPPGPPGCHDPPQGA